MTFSSSTRTTSFFSLPGLAVAEADLLAFYLPMHTATRLAIAAIEKVRMLNPGAAAGSGSGAAGESVRTLAAREGYHSANPFVCAGISRSRVSSISNVIPRGKARSRGRITLWAIMPDAAPTAAPIGPAETAPRVALPPTLATPHFPAPCPFNSASPASRCFNSMRPARRNLAESGTREPSGRINSLRRRCSSGRSSAVIGRRRCE